MAIQGMGSSASAAAYLGGQLARQQAERSAQQLEAKAAALAAEASSARKEADSAQRRAEDLQVQAGQARTRADLGKQAVESVRGMDRVAGNVSATVDRAVRAAGLQASDEAPGQSLSASAPGSVETYTPAATTRVATANPPGQIVNVTV